ncbi:putative ABC transport system permease protein [Algoriella xinjiangensis]|uniref:Putative ABC transport system permease protein n=1 Tax=Algoriella xinjiangensis TaxID=684065 RepID=A0A1I5B294_9FLAO|nr:MULTISPECIES: ABC transporter permease [Algoriella]MBO6213823.1 ABC transporter permease [Algoriella sp.]SFN68836.1 putative ABC transport system permease protein [Algoriella xinjiangensis]VDH16954.1 Macrolide export ATP-binding/permease protein MacB [Algoriella xinjiangensis]
MNLVKFIFDPDAWSEVYSAIRKNKLRTVLTMIGVAWGMFLFVLLLGVTRGLQNGFDRNLADAATNSLFVWGGTTSVPYEGFQKGRTIELKMSDVRQIKARFPQISLMAPRNSKPNSIIAYGSKYNFYSVNGDYPDQNRMFGKDIVQGRFINEDDIKDETKVCVIGIEVAEQYFGSNPHPLGKQIRISDSYYTIVGVYDTPSSPVESKDQVFIPFTTFQKVYNQGEIIQYLCLSLPNQYNISDFEKELKTYIKQLKNIAPDDDQAIGGFNLGEMLGKIMKFVKGMQFLAVVVGAMTLFSGVIAIASILLITVSERTKEFGIRRALGAVPAQIRGQILLESVVLTLIAGLGGIVFAGLLLMVLNEIIIPGNKNIPLYNASIDLFTLFSALVIMVVMATLAGLIPAQRAIQIKPIDALREE